MQIAHIGLVGHGEVGRIFSAGLRIQPGVESVCAWDLKFADPRTARDAVAAAAGAGVKACESMAQLCRRSDLVISAVTASNTLAVAREAAGHLRPGSLFLDLNSASPGTKLQAARRWSRRPARTMWKRGS
jgi:3-hydroxyisobutyrate dehydrogenase-like beta-hydroxyacid dehydrogenase